MATFTSVSLMSTSAWNGPGGSPIVSPSRWNALVASNLGVLANHDHSASMGEGASTAFSACYFPVMDVQYIAPWFPVYNNGWVLENRDNWPEFWCMATSTLGAVIEYDVYMRPGKWQLLITHGYGQGYWAASIGGSRIDFALQTLMGDDWVQGGFSEHGDAYKNLYTGPVAWNDITSSSYTYGLPADVMYPGLLFPTFGSGIGSGKRRLRIKLVGQANSYSSCPEEERPTARIGLMLLWRTSD